jgi:5-methylcytosine-specific restriction protein A
MASTRVSVSLCSTLRNRTEAGDGSTELADEYDLSVGTIRYHIYGECGHDVEPESLTPPPVGLSESECREIRTRYASSADLDDIAEELGHTWKATARHLFGECHHDEDDLVVERREVLQRMPVIEKDCASLRRTYHEEDDVDLLEIARNVPWNYQTVLTHVNGECTHEVDAPTRTIGKRAHISEELCREFRERYRNNKDLTLSKLDPLAEDYEASAGSIQRHIRFRCLHDPESTLLDRVDGWQELVDEDGFGEHIEEIEEPVDEAEPSEEEVERGLSYVEIAAETGVHAPDETEAVADLPQPDADRVETTTARIVRNTQAGKELKELYQYHCQLCGEARHRAPLEHYAEVHHLKPLGRPHEGPEEQSNMLVLCPNHHSDFDHGLLHVDPETFEVTHATDESVSGRELLRKDDHVIDEDVVRYHNEEISKL